MTLAPELRTPADQVAARLDDPEVAAALGTLLDHADLLAVLVEGLDGLVRRGDEISETLAGGIAELRDGLGVGEAGLPAGGDVARVAETARRLAASDLLQPEAVTQINTLARGLVRGSEAYTTTPVPVTGLLSLTRVLKDPDVQRSLSYLATVARAIGRELDQPR